MRQITFILFFLSVLALRGAAQEPGSPLLESFEAYRQAKAESEFGLEWVSLGPVMNSARVEAVQADPDSPETMYAAFGSGNLWKTGDGGLTWKAIFEEQSALGIGDIALAPSDPRIIWLGSGESLKKARNFTMPGTGVFRSEDGGESWRNVGLHDSWHIGEIAVHPEDPDTAFVAVLGHFWSTNRNRGLYRTRDGGESWEHVLHVDERTGANDVVICAANPDVVYASLWHNHPGVSGPNSGVYRSSDGGTNWTRLEGGLPTGDATGRIGLAVSWTNPNKVYALIDNLNRREHPTEIYRSLDGGESWRRTHEEDLQFLGRIGWYFADCCVNPQDDEEIFGLGVRLAHSTNGGETFSLVGGKVFHLFPNPARTLHLDHCELWIDPERPDRLILGNDGGLFVSQDRGHTWLHHNNIPAGEFYDIAVDNQEPYLGYGGVQDDSSVFGPPVEWIPELPDRWRYVWLDPWSGGDGCYTVPDPEDPDTVYFSSQHNGIRRKNVRTNRSVPIQPRLPRDFEGELRHNFIAPYIISPHDHRTLYHGGNYVMGSVDRGDSWEVVSPDITRSGFTERESTAAGAIAESPLQPGRLYAGTDRGAFWVRSGIDEEWVERSAGLPPRYIRSICPSRFSPTRVYVAATGINDDDLRGHLYASEDDGESWRSILGNLPDEVAYAILEDPVREDILYAGMYRGVYVSTDRGRSWSLLGRGMPAAAVSDLVIQEREMDLLASTHGRGIYRMNLRPLQEAFEADPPSENRLFDIPPAQLPPRDDIHSIHRTGLAEKTPITFFLTSESAVTLTVRDDEDEVIFRRHIQARRGFNQFRWDLVLERRESPKPYFLGQLRFVEEGTYEVVVSGGGVELRGACEVSSPWRMALGPSTDRGSRSRQPVDLQPIRQVEVVRPRTTVLSARGVAVPALVTLRVTRGYGTLGRDADGSRGYPEAVGALDLETDETSTRTSKSFAEVGPIAAVHTVVRLEVETRVVRVQRRRDQHQVVLAHARGPRLGQLRTCGTDAVGTTRSRDGSIVVVGAGTRPATARIAEAVGHRGGNREEHVGGAPAVDGGGCPQNGPDPADSDRVSELVARRAVLRAHAGELDSRAHVEGIGTSGIRRSTLAVRCPDHGQTISDVHALPEELVVDSGGREELEQLLPVRHIEDVGGAGVRIEVVVPGGADQGLAVVQGHAPPEVVLHGSVRGDDLVELTPVADAEHVRRTEGPTVRVVVEGADDHMIPIDRHVAAEVVTRVAIIGYQLEELLAGRSVEDVGRTRPGSVDGIAGRSDDDVIGTDRHAGSEPVTGEIVGRDDQGNLLTGRNVVEVGRTTKELVTRKIVGGGSDHGSISFDRDAESEHHQRVAVRGREVAQLLAR